MQRGGVSKRYDSHAHTAVGKRQALDDFTSETGWRPSGPPVSTDDGAMLFPMAEGGIEGVGIVAELSSGETVTPLIPLGSNLGGVPIGGFLDTGSGFIGLQIHGIKDEAGPFEVAWRKIRIKELVK